MEVRSKKQGSKTQARGLARQLSEGLWSLLSLLNTESESAFRDEMYRQEGDLRRFDDKWVQAAWHLRGEIFQDVTPLIEQRRGLRLDAHLKALVEKINGINLKSVLGVWPARPILWTIQSKGKVIKVGNPAYGKLGPGQRVLKIGKQKWIVSTTFDFFDSPRGYFYGTLAEALKEGQFSRLRRCQWKECRKFFIADDGRRKAYCSTKCAEASDRDDAKYRIKKWRQRHKED